MVIGQHSANGDILFIEPICRHIWQKTGVKPILPVRDHLMWLSNHIESADFRPMSQFKLDYDSIDNSNPDYLPLRFANQIVRGLSPHDHSDYANTMPDKYELAGLPLELWKTLKFTYSEYKGVRLMSELGLSLTDRYILINENSQAGNISINPDNPNGYKVIKMREMHGYPLLDWTLVIKLAQENHHISTSTFFIMEFLKLETPIYLYPRPNEDGLQGISKLNPSFNYKIGLCE